MTRNLTVACAAFTLCAAAAPAATTPPSLSGQVRIVSAEPNCSAKGCGAPVGALRLRFTAAGVAHTIRTGPSGAFRAWLPPGTYAVSAPQTDLGTATIAPARVVLVRGVSRHVSFVLRIAPGA